MAEGLDLLGTKHMRGQELPSLPPVLAVGRKRDVGGTIPDDVGGQGRRSRCEDVVVGVEDGLGGAWRRHKQGGSGAEPEEHEAVAAILGVELPDGYVGLGAQEVGVADDRKHARR